MRLPDIFAKTNIRHIVLLASLSVVTFTALLFTTFSTEFVQLSTMMLFAYWIAALFATIAIGGVALRARGASQVFWSTLFGGLFLRLVAETSGEGFPLFDLLPPIFALNDVVYAGSYLLLLGSLIWLLVKTTRSEISLIATLDTATAMFSSGLLAWYFLISPAAEEAGLDSWQELLIALTGPMCDVGLLSLSLVVIATGRRPAFVYPLVGAFAFFLVAGGVSLALQPLGPQGSGTWPELAQALGFALAGLSALMASSFKGFARELQIKPWTVFALWFSPLSPAMHLALLLGWGALYSPLPPYGLWAAAALILYFAFRISISSYMSRKLSREVEGLAARTERIRISEELHDTLKQTVYSTALLLSSYHKARDKRGAAAAEEVLDRAIEASREANHQVSTPIEEFRTLNTASSGIDFDMLLQSLINDIHRYYGVEVHEDLQADPGILNPEELAAAYRIASEALWNAAKHSQAKNVWLQSRQVGNVFLVKIRDDGRGLSMEDFSGGSGLSLMEERAQRSGGKLAVCPDSRGGTSVQVWFEKR